jgi:chromosome segregation ATPase
MLQQQLADATGQLSVLQEASGAAVQQETTLRQQVADLQAAVAQQEQQATQLKAAAAQAEAEKQQLLSKLAATAAAKESVSSQVGQPGSCMCVPVSLCHFTEPQDIPVAAACSNGAHSF